MTSPTPYQSAVILKWPSLSKMASQTSPTPYQCAVIAKQLIQKHGLVFKHNKTHKLYKLVKRVSSRVFETVGKGGSEHAAMQDAIAYLNEQGKINWASLEVNP